MAIKIWLQTQINSQDVEFVIRTSTKTVLGSYHPDHRIALPPVSTFDDFSKGEIQMWMLDFDQVEQVDLSDAMHGSAKDRFMILVEVHHAANAFPTSFKQTASRRPAVPFLNNLASLTI